jgi:hypothetical protein
LVDCFNRHLLDAVLNSTGIQHLDGEIENTFRLLSDDDVSSADRTRVRRCLERDGLDVDELEHDFVTYQEIRSYPKGYQGAEYGPARMREDESPATPGSDGCYHGKEIEQFRDSLELGDFRILAGIEAAYEDCNDQFYAVELLERGGCNCTTTE